jgi:hypothetical protein
MSNSAYDFEKFIGERFVENYNDKESAAFHIINKADIAERNKRIYDFYCVDNISGKKMAIEIKRLFPKDRSAIKSVEKEIHTYIEKPIRGKIIGDYSLLIKDYKFIFGQKKRKRKVFFKALLEEIISIGEPVDYYKIRLHDGLALFRWSETGSDITAWPIDFSSADEEEVARLLDASIKKFNNKDIINLILLVELSSVSRRDEIPSIIEDLKIGIEPKRFSAEKRDFKMIRGIYHIGLFRDTVIARVFPEDQIYEMEFFDPSKYMEPSQFRQFINKHLL